MKTKTYIEDLTSTIKMNNHRSSFEYSNLNSDLDSNLWVLQMMKLVHGKEIQTMIEFINELYYPKYESKGKTRVLAK